jgi:hypothetical protein
MSAGALLLPGERPRSEIRASRAFLALGAGFGWLLLRSTLVPAALFETIPFDPLLPLVLAFALGAPLRMAWVLALSLGLLADFFAGMGDGRATLQFALVVVFSMPLRGRVILRDRVLPSLGVAVVALASGGIVLLLLGGMGAATAMEGQVVPLEALGSGLAALLGWPIYNRIAGGSRGHRIGQGRLG